MLTVFLMGNYKRPRELTWVGGALLLLVTIAFGFSGYLLPWTQLSYWATTVVTSIPTAVPVVGDVVARVLRGGDQVTGTTLSRFFAFHVSVLPPLFLILAGMHVFLIKRIGISATPFGLPAEEKRPWTEYHKKSHADGYPYYPRFFQMDMLMVMGYLAVMFFLITVAPNLFFPRRPRSRRTPSGRRPMSTRSGTCSRRTRCSGSSPTSSSGSSSNWRSSSSSSCGRSLTRKRRRTS